MSLFATALVAGRRCDVAYSDKDWDAVKALYERGLSLSEIVERDEVPIKSRGSISKRAKAEGWEHGKKKQAVSEEVELKQRVEEIRKQKETLGPVERTIHDTLVSERLKLEKFFRSASVLVAKTVTSKLQKEADSATFQDLNAASNALTKAQENVLGKQPDTVINNANTLQTAISIDRSPERVKEIREMLDAAIGRR